MKDCNIIYNNQTYSLEDFKEVLISDKNLLSKVLEDVKNRINALKAVFNENPILSNYGSLMQYDKYLNERGLKISEVNVPDYLNWLGVNEESGKRTFSDNDRSIIVEDIIGKALSNLNLSEEITVNMIYSAVENEFNKLVLKTKLKEKNSEEKHETNFLEEIRGSVLGTESYDNSVKEYINSLLDVQQLEEVLDQTGENIKEVGQASYEVNITASMSFKVKMMLSGIKDTRKEDGFSGIKPNMPLNETLDVIHQALSDAGNNSFKDLIQTLKNKMSLNPTGLKFYQSIIDKLEAVNKTNPEIINEILYNLYQPKTDMKFVMWNQNSNGNIELSTLDANVKNPLFIKRAQWLENIKLNGLIEQYEGNHYFINEQAYDSVKEIYTRINDSFSANKNIADVNSEDLEEILNYFGITLDPMTYQNMYSNQSQNDVDLVTKILNGKNSVLGVLMSNLEKAKNSKAKLTFSTQEATAEDSTKFDLLNNNNSQLNDIIKADNFVSFLPMGTMYIAGKSINMYQQPNPINNQMKEFKAALLEYQNNLDNPEVTDDNKLPGILKRFKDSPYTSNSFLVDLMINNPTEMLKYMDTFLISLEALKKQGSKSRDDMEMTDLSDKDAFITLFGMFSSSEGVYVDREMSERYGNSFKFRKGYINFPTISDSSQLPFMKTVLIEFSNENIDTVENKFDEATLSLLREQLLLSDLYRIADYIANVEATGSNIKEYDTGALWITGIPSLNNIYIETGTEDNPSEVAFVELFRNLIRQNPALNTKENIQAFVEEHAAKINTEIQASIQNEVDQLVNAEGKGLLSEYELLDEKGKFKLGNDRRDAYYKDKSARLLAYDYVINNLIQQKDIQSFFAGDIALYFKGKLGKNLENGLPKVTDADILSFYLNTDQQAEALKLKELYDAGSISREDLLNEFPEALAILPTTSMQEIEEVENMKKEVVSYKIADMFKDVQNNLSKRLKGQISPGSQFADTANIPDHLQIVLNDVDAASETFLSLLKSVYPNKYATLEKDVKEFKELDELYSKTLDQSDRFNSLLKKLRKELPLISAYLQTSSTDAQEYVTWEDNLNQLKGQGRISNNLFESLKRKFEGQSKDLEEGDSISEENLLSLEEMQAAIMQPSKPLYSGLVDTLVGNHKMQRYVYVKSSSFPLLPQMTQMFPKLNGLRKNMEALSKSEGTTVRAAYQSAIKVGSLAKGANVGDMYAPQSIETLKQYSIRLPRKNFFIQQDKPFKSDSNAKKGKEDRNVRATQFEKILLGDGVNKLGYVFPGNMFDSSLLADLNIEVNEKGLLKGPDLKKIYDELYKREQKIFSKKLFDQLGITAYSDIAKGNPSIMENLARMLNKRLTNKQDRKALELLYEVEVPFTTPDNKRSTRIEVMSKQEMNKAGLYPRKAIFKFPLFMTPNSRKFESVLNSVINKNSINLTLSGFSAPVASQEGFDFRGYSEEAFNIAKKNGLIVTENFDPSKGLQATKNEDGSLKYAQVFAPSKFKVFNAETGEYNYIDLKQFVNENNVIDNAKLPKELLSFFSYRIPTSAHQSGTVIEIAGFLPHIMGDVLIVPKDHTTQIGEDYDIDTRNMYGYHYVIDGNGALKKLDYNDIDSEGYERLEAKYEEFKQKAFDKYFYDENGKPKIKNPSLQFNKENALKVASLNHILENWGDPEVKTILDAVKDDMDFEGTLTKRDLKNYIADLELDILPVERVAESREESLMEYRRLKAALRQQFQDRKEALLYFRYKSQKANEQKVLENNLVSLYKTVFSSSSPEVQNLITKVLSTDFSEDTAQAIDTKLARKSPYFNIYSPLVQRRVMKLGADGKMGIGVHSNSVTFASILQQLDQPLQFYSSQNPETGEYYPYKIRLGKNVFDGILGKTESHGVRISESLMESQNSSTDNQKLEIMGRRNENSETINVFSLLQVSGLERDGMKINVDGNIKELSYPSLFISQPIIQEFVDLVKKYKSSTTDIFGNPETVAYEFLANKYAELVPENFWKVEQSTGNVIKGVFNNEAKYAIGSGLTSKNLYDQISDFRNMDSNVSFADQYYILDAFMKLKKPAGEFSNLQKIINIESSGMGVSYFDTIEKKDAILSLAEFKILPQDTIAGKSEKTLFSSLLGNVKTVSNDNQDYIESLLEDDYIYFETVSTGNGESLSIYIKPNNHFAHKIINSVATGYNMWNSLFPYDNEVIKSQINDILRTAGVNKGTKAALEINYDVISSMKDFSFTSSNTLFGSNINLVKNKLFFDDKENNQESLSSYLLKLKNDENFRYLFDQPFFRDLQFQINSKEFPSIIKFITGDMSTFNNLRMYNNLEKMVDSSRKLPNRLNGEEMTEADLMKDLLSYALIANQENGAIGFRHLLPLSLFEKYKVDALIRKNTSAVGDYDNSSIIYKGARKSAENFLGSDMDDTGLIVNANNNRSVKESIFFAKLLNSNLGREVYLTNDNGDIIDSSFTDVSYNENKKYNFTRQYIQHNPGIVKPSYAYSESTKSNFYNLLASNKFSLKNFNDGLVNEFSLETNRRHDYITLRNKRGELYLFERVGTSQFSDGLKEGEFQYYKRIETLGAFGFNEYQVGSDIDKSSVLKNNFSNSRTAMPVNVENANYLLTQMEVEEVFSSMLKNPKSEYAPLLKMIEGFIPDLDKVSFKMIDSDGFTGNYNTVTNTIEISTKALKEYSDKRLEKMLVEEFLHHITHTHIGKYINFTGVTPEGKLQYSRVKDAEDNSVEMPPSLEHLLTIYQAAVSHYYNKVGAEKFAKDMDVMNNYNANTSTEESGDTPIGITSDQLYAYRLKNIHEFTAGIFLKNEDFNLEMSLTPYRKSGKSILARFAETLARFFKSVLPFAKKDSISANFAGELINFLDTSSNVNSDTIVTYTNPLSDRKVMAQAIDFLASITNVNSIIPEVNPEVIEGTVEIKNSTVTKKSLYDISKAPSAEATKIKEDFDNKKWAYPNTEKDGSKANAYEYNTFSDIAQYYTYVKLAQSLSNTPLQKGETYGKRQSRINADAMTILFSEFEVPGRFDLSELDGLSELDLAAYYEANNVYLGDGNTETKIDC